MSHIKISETYEKYINILESKYYFREEIYIRENNDFVELKSIKKGFTDNIIIIRCPGEYHTHKLVLHKNSSFKFNIKDENNIEIDKHTKIRIFHIRPSEFVNQLSRTFYDNLKECCYEDISKQIFTSMKGNDRLTFVLVNSPVNIPKENIKFGLTTDLWIKKVD